jgi:hypothetical protein
VLDDDGVLTLGEVPVSTPATKIRIFLASPGDVGGEREQLAKVVQELNITLSALAPARGVVLELVRWETHVHPGLGRDAQDVVNQQIGDYDIFVGIMWRRFGTKTKIAESGTEEEFRIAHTAWERTRKLFQILFYFCQAPAAPPATAEEVAQLGRVVAFRQELTQRGLVWEYADHSAFSDTVRPHLIMVFGRMLQSASPAAVATGTAQAASASDVAVARHEVRELAKEYEKLRREMLPGDARTRRLEVVASRMRTIALSLFPLLAELSGSDSPGERLAAVTTLQSIPHPAYLTWLAERLSQERPFIGYHAALALLNAARTLDGTELPLVGDALALARRAAVKPDTDRNSTLKLAEEELARRQLSEARRA